MPRLTFAIAVLSLAIAGPAGAMSFSAFPC
jgi:hypothetical protein